VKPEHVRDIVHGAIFTRGPKDLRYTAIFVGGSDVGAGERLLAEVRKHMLPQFGLQVSALLDANGANTTAAAAVVLAAKHITLSGARALVLGGTGPVGQRVARLLVGQGADVAVGSREQSRAEAVCEALRRRIPGARAKPVVAGSETEVRTAIDGRNLVVTAGAAGVVLLARLVREAAQALKVAIDLNAVPPLGIDGVEAADKAVERNNVVCYGALGVGGIKMKIHKLAIAKLFDRNDQIMDAEEAYELAKSIS
jgi:hypothetical protein